MNYQYTTLKEFVVICQLKRCFEQQIGQHNCSVVFSAKFIDASRPDYVGLDLNDRQIWLKKYQSSYLLNPKIVKIVLLVTSLKSWIHESMLAVNNAFSYAVYSLC